MAAIMIGHIEIIPGVCAGKPHIAGHRITVQNVAIWHERMGMEPDEIATEYGLTLGEVYAALAYYHDHRDEIDAAIRADDEDEIDAAIRADDEFVAEMRRRTPSKLAEKLRGRTN